MARFWERQLPSRSSEEFTSDQEPPIGRNWLVLVGYFLAALVVAIIIVFGARGIYHHVHKKKPASTTSTNQPSTQSPATNPATPPGQGSQNQPQPSPSNLPNNGPGDVIALFVGTSLVSAGLHYIITARRSG